MSAHSERRRHERLPTSMNVVLSHPATGSRVVRATDLSEGGVFVANPSAAMAAIGDQVMLKVNGLLDRSPEVVLEVVRKTREGLGLKFP